MPLNMEMGAVFAKDVGRQKKYAKKQLRNCKKYLRDIR